jgi:thiosulfate/3-mercaptopyruvate sulfurtransferase
MNTGRAPLARDLLLGYPDVKNYDGSWTEYDSLVREPVEKGA